MIGSNWKKSLVVAGAALAVAAAIPAMSNAQYTGMTSPGVSMPTTVTPVTKVSAKKGVHSKSLKKATAKLAKHKHKKLSGKKHAA